jgi:glycosyltransferase involved in cell wall biosynthesis
MVSPLKILVTASTLPRRVDDAVPSFVLDQVLALKRVRPDFEFRMLAPHDPGASVDEVIDGVRIHRFRYAWPERLQLLAYPAILPNLRRRPWLWLLVPALLVAETAALFRLARAFRPQVVYSHWFTPQALAGHLVTRLLGITHVFTTHSSDVEVLRRVPLLGPPLVRHIARHCRAFTAVSRRTASRLQACFAPAAWTPIASRLRIVPMGVDTAALAGSGPEGRRRARAALELDDVPVLLFMGRLTAKKGLAFLLAALAGLRNTGRAVRLLVAGDGDQREEIVAELHRLDLGSSVRLLGYVTGERKRECLLAADLLVIPSIIAADQDAEGLPVVLLEGMAAGCVCVATDVSGADDVLTDGVEGFLVAGSSPRTLSAQLAATIARVLDMSPLDRDAVAARAAARAQDFDWVVIARQHVDHLFAGDPA